MPCSICSGSGHNKKTCTVGPITSAHIPPPKKSKTQPWPLAAVISRWEWEKECREYGNTPDGKAMREQYNMDEELAAYDKRLSYPWRQPALNEFGQTRKERVLERIPCKHFAGGRCNRDHCGFYYSSMGSRITTHPPKIPKSSNGISNMQITN